MSAVANKARRLSAVMLAVLLALQGFTLTVFASDDEDDEDSGIMAALQEIYEIVFELPDTISDIFDKVKDLPGKVSSMVSDMVSIKDKIEHAWNTMLAVDGEVRNFFGYLKEIPLIISAYRHYSDDLVNQINKMYNLFYPLGVCIMLVCWAYGISKDGLTSMFDLADKHSIVRSCLSIIIGLTVLSMTSMILSVLISVSKQYTELLAQTILPPAFSSTSYNISYSVFICIINLIMQLNVIHIAVLQGIAPLFMAFSGGSGTRRLTFNFLKSYAKCLLVPITTIAYTVFAAWTLEASGGWNVVNVIVILIACTSTQKKILSELFA